MTSHVLCFATNVLCVVPSCWYPLLYLLYYYWRLAAMPVCRAWRFWEIAGLVYAMIGVQPGLRRRGLFGAGDDCDPELERPSDAADLPGGA